ncbi:GNAT family N-acetyltransferase [Nocardia sp. NBC_00881]|uniref:GNAT family N-acetyltransferase n=1 Tax=Nocardia sp. NBC_00881 TaxID=2975995 RepID=UPI00386F24AF|nr:GNAT family N-acetyltransferase [Nocardia sp. NBC_00881]
MVIASGVTLRSASEQDTAAIRLLLATSFGGTPEPDPVIVEQAARLWPVERALVAVDADRIVGHTREATMTLTVPGERTVQACGIAAVAVAPTHRRRGILRAMYTEQHQRTETAGLPLTIFTASQGSIYQRFGYGPTVVQNRVSIDRRFAEFLPTAPDPGGVHLTPLEDAIPLLPPIYDRWRRLTPGAQVRPDPAWTINLAHLAADRTSETTGVFALVHPDGYALYRYHHRASGMEAEVIELRAVTTHAHAALWRTMLGLDLVHTVHATISSDDPLPYLLTDPRLVRTTGRYDGLWARLMDIPAALSARTYRRDLDIVLAVTDPFRNAGGSFALRVRDGIPECEPTTRTADVELGIDVLASMYLGAHRARALSAAHRLQAEDSRQLHALDEAFGTDRDAVLGWYF